MEGKKGIAYCGLACAACSADKSCPGCHSDGCSGKDWCVNYKCCKERGFSGCFECPDFPESSASAACCGMLSKPKPHAFSVFIRRYGIEKLLDCLKRNEADGLIYHYGCGIAGDYDKPATEEGIIELILSGRQKR